MVRESPVPEPLGSQSSPFFTPLEVARFLFATSAEMQLLPQDEEDLATAEIDNAEQARLEAEVERTEAEIAAAETELLLLAADAAIDLAGIVDPTPISDGIAMARDVSRGDYFGAVLSGISMFPWLGDALAKPIKATRILDRVNDVKKLLAKLQKRAASLRKRLNKPGKGPIKDTGKLPERKPPEGKLPGKNVLSLEQVHVPEAKFRDYIFKPGATHGKDRVFKSLGYGPEHSQQLVEMYRKQAHTRYLDGNYNMGKKDQYGQRIDIEIVLEGIDSSARKSSRSKSGWMILEAGGIKLNTPFTGFLD